MKKDRDKERKQRQTQKDREIEKDSRKREREKQEIVKNTCNASFEERDTDNWSIFEIYFIHSILGYATIIYASVFLVNANHKLIG